MARLANHASLVAHGGAGVAGPREERSERRRGMLQAIRAGARVLRQGGSALDAVVATVAALEDHPLFNAGYGSVLNTEGEVEMDASVMAATPDDGQPGGFRLRAGAVAAVSRVRNPVMLARAVMENTKHLLMVGRGAERFARQAGIRLCRADELISPRARKRWRERMEHEARSAHGTVGAVALDARGQIAAATSTGGVTGKMPGRVGDSAIIGAGTFADSFGAASATGEGEAIIMAGLCREAAGALGRARPALVARRAIASMIAPSGAQAGIVLVDRHGRVGYAHNAASMQVGIYDSRAGLSHLWVEPLGARRRS